jgi:hypothetical protein
MQGAAKFTDQIQPHEIDSGERWCLQVESREKRTKIAGSVRINIFS